MRAIATAAALLLPALALAQAAVPAPRLLPYQGRLLRADGTPESDTQRLTFRVYAAPDAPSALWSEAQDVPLRNGFYAVFLGAVSIFPDALFDGHDRWLGVTIGDGTELTPRQQIASVAYAMTATNALRAASADQASSAAVATRAAAADRAASADYARTAGSAATADTATRTARADHATSADSALTAVTATNLTGTGDLTAGNITATGGFSAGGAVSAQEIRASGDVVVGGDLHLTGRLIGGGPRMVGLVQLSHEHHEYSTPADRAWTCSAWGAAQCGADSDTARCTLGDLVPLITTSAQAGTERVPGAPDPIPFSRVTAQSICFLTE